MFLQCILGAKGDWDFWISDLLKNPDGTDINPCGEFRLSSEGPFSHIHSPHLHVGAPGIFSDLLRSVQMLKREWGTESNGKLPHLFNPWSLPRWSSGYHTRLWIRGSRVRFRTGSMDFSERKNLEYDFLRKGSKAVGPLS